MPPVPSIVGSQKFSACVNVVSTRALFAGVGSAIATAATSSSSGYQDHRLATGGSSVGRPLYQPYFASHQYC